MGIWIKINLVIQYKIKTIKTIRTNKDKFIMSLVINNNKTHFYNNFVRIYKKVMFSHKNLPLVKIFTINSIK